MRFRLASAALHRLTTGVLLHHPAVFSASMPVVAARALFCGLGIIDAMVNRLHRLQIGEDGLQVIVGHVFEKPPRHGRVQRPCADVPGSQGRNEKLFVVVGNAAGIGGDISTDQEGRILDRLRIFNQSFKFRGGGSGINGMYSQPHAIFEVLSFPRRHQSRGAI